MTAPRFDPASLVGLPEREIPRMLPGENHALVLARRGAPEGWPKEIVEREKAAQIDVWRRVDSDGVVRPFMAFSSGPGAPAFVYERWFRAARPVALLLFDEDGICRHADGPEVTSFTRKLEAAEALESALGLAPPEAQAATEAFAARSRTAAGTWTYSRESLDPLRYVVTNTDRPTGADLPVVDVREGGLRFSSLQESKWLCSEDVFGGSLPIRVIDDSQTERACALVSIKVRERPVLELVVRDVSGSEAFDRIRAWLSVGDVRGGDIVLVDPRGHESQRLAIESHSAPGAREGWVWLTAR